MDHSSKCITNPLKGIVCHHTVPLQNVLPPHLQVAQELSTSMEKLSLCLLQTRNNVRQQSPLLVWPNDASIGVAQLAGLKLHQTAPHSWRDLCPENKLLLSNTTDNLPQSYFRCLILRRCGAMRCCRCQADAVPSSEKVLCARPDLGF